MALRPRCAYMPSWCAARPGERSTTRRVPQARFNWGWATITSCRRRASTSLPSSAAWRTRSAWRSLAGRFALPHVSTDQRNRPAPHQRRPQHIALLGRHLDQEALLPFRFFHHNRHAIAVQDPITGNRRDRLARREDTDQVQRICATHRDELSCSLLPARGSQQANRLRERVLLPREPAHEPAASNFAARFEPPIDAQDVAPRSKQGFALHEATEHDAVAAQQLPRDGFGYLLVGNGRAPVGPRPAARRLDAERRDAPATAVPTANRPAPIGRHQQRAQSRKAVG